MLDDLLEGLKLCHLVMEFIENKWFVSIDVPYKMSSKNANLLAALLEIYGKVKNR